MSNIGVATNNPGNLLAGSEPYPGQTGVYNSPNGLSYAVFGTPQAGQSALLQWLGDNVGSNDNTSLTNLGEVASYFLNGSYDPLTSTANNPYANNWLQTVENATGLNATSTITPNELPAIASGIEKAEGTYGAFGPVAGTQVASSGNPIADFITNAITGAGAITSFVTGQPVQNQGQTITPQAAGTAIANASNGAVSPNEANSIGSTLNSITSALGTLTSGATWERIAVVLLALIALAGGIYLLGRQPPVLLKGT